MGHPAGAPARDGSEGDLRRALQATDEGQGHYEVTLWQGSGNVDTLRIVPAPMGIFDKRIVAKAFINTIWETKCRQGACSLMSGLGRRF
jgi:hypothetical protein